MGLTEGLRIPGNQQRQQAKGWQIARLPVLSRAISPTSLGTSAMFRMWFYPYKLHQVHAMIFLTSAKNFPSLTLLYLGAGKIPSGPLPHVPSTLSAHSNSTLSL